MKEIDINRIVDETINEMFNGTNKGLLREADTVYTTRAKKDLVNAFQKYYDKNKDTVSRRAKNIGVNLDRGAERSSYGDEMLKQHSSYENALKQMSPEIRDAITAMKRVKDPNTPKEERDAIYRKYGGFGGLQRYRDILDKMSLTPTYDHERTKEAGINRAPFGTKYMVNKDGQTTLSATKPQKTPAKYDKNGTLKNPEIPADEVIGYDYENLDLTDVPEAEIINYFTDGTRKNHRLDEDPNNPTYKELSVMAKDGDKNALEVLKNLYFKAEFNKVMNSQFGYDFKIPGAMYTYGNAKLPDDTLVINFTTAHRCPAWEECLVGYACYARGSEHNYEGLHKKNSNLHLMWLSSREDPELMTAMQRVIKSYLVNPEEMARALLNNKNTRNKWIKFLTNGKTTFNQVNGDTNANMKMPENPVLGITGDNEVEELPGMEESTSILGKVIEEMEMEATAQKPKKLKQPTGASANLGSYIYNSNWSEIFSKYDIAAIKANPKVFRAKFIRLNEEGDFIGQWLLDAFDVFAGELKLLGISTAAYTCRNLNFTKIKNIILNASTINVGTKGEEEGNVSNAIARRFFAISNELYDSLEDTYVLNNRKFTYVPPEGAKKNKKEDYSRPFIPLHRQDGGWKVKYALKPYTLDGNTAPVEFNDRFDPNGPTKKQRLYYKCPCGRYGDMLKDGKPIKMDCYMCRMCYEPKNQKTGEVYVLVAVHGDNVDSFDMNKANKARGINNTMSTYNEARNIFGNRLSEHTQMSEKLGLSMVSNNVIESAKKHISEIADSEVSAMQNESKKFSDMLNRMNESEK